MFHLVASLPPSDYAKKTLGLGNNSDVTTCSVSQQHYITRWTIHLVTSTDYDNSVLIKRFIYIHMLTRFPLYCVAKLEDNKI